MNTVWSERGGDVVDAYLDTRPGHDESTDRTGITGATGEGVVPINQAEPADTEPDTAGEAAGDVAWWNVPGRRSARLDAGRTWRVRHRARSAAQEHRLAATESPEVLRAERGVADAERLEEIDSDARTEARANRRIRTWVQRLIGASVAGGLAISSSTAQATVVDTMGWTAENNPFAYAAAYGADPVLGLLLFAVLFVRSLATNRGVALGAAVSQVFSRTEKGLFALVAGLNGGPAVAALIRSLAAETWPSAVPTLDVLGHGVMSLVIHLLGPVLVGLAVYALPHVMDLLRQISVRTSRRLATGATEPDEAVSALVDRANGVPAKWHGDLAEVLRAIDEGRLPVDPSGGRILALVGGDAAKKPYLREAVDGYRPEGVAA